MDAANTVLTIWRRASALGAQTSRLSTQNTNIHKGVKKRSQQQQLSPKHAARHAQPNQRGCAHKRADEQDKQNDGSHRPCDLSTLSIHGQPGLWLQREKQQANERTMKQMWWQARRSKRARGVLQREVTKQGNCANQKALRKEGSPVAAACARSKHASKRRKTSGTRVSPINQQEKKVLNVRNSESTRKTNGSRTRKTPRIYEPPKQKLSNSNDNGSSSTVPTCGSSSRRPAACAPSARLKDATQKRTRPC